MMISCNEFPWNTFYWDESVYKLTPVFPVVECVRYSGDNGCLNSNIKCGLTM